MVQHRLADDRANDEGMELAETASTLGVPSAEELLHAGVSVREPTENRDGETLLTVEEGAPLVDEAPGATSTGKASCACCADKASAAAYSSSVDYDYPTKKRRGTISGCVPLLPCASKVIGRMMVFRSAPDGKPTCVVGPCWPCLTVTYTLIIGISSMLFAALLPHCHPIVAGLSIGFLLCVLGSLSGTACSNPGILPRHREAPTENWKYHSVAETYHAPELRAHYCSDAQVLVHGHDHFCPWTGTVIAGNNIRYFYMFVSGLMGLLLWIFFLVVFGQSTALGGDGGRIRAAQQAFSPDGNSNP